MWPEPSPAPAPPTPRLRDSRVVRATFAVALAVALIALVATGSLIAAEHFRADLHNRTDLALAGLAALGLLTEVADVVTRILRWGFRRPPAPALAARAPLTWAPSPPSPPPEPPALAPVVPLRRRDRREQEQERRRVQAALILGPAAPPAPPPAPRPNRRDREPRPHRRPVVPRQPRREPRPSRQPKGLVVGWSHAEQDGRVAMWLRGTAGTQCVEGEDLDVVEAEVDGRLREAVVRGEHAEIVTGRDLRALARAWAEQKGADR